MTTNFTQKELDSMKDLFDKIDTDKNGYLDKHEFKSFLEKSGLDTKFIDAIFLVFGKDSPGLLTFNEFTGYLNACVIAEKDSKHLFRLIFEAVDKNKNGLLELDEVMEFTKLCGVVYSEEKAKEEVAKLDLNKDGKLDFYEICRAFNL